MANGNGKDMEVNSGVCFANSFNGVRPCEGEKGEKSPLFAEGRFYISPEVAAMAQLSGGAYVTAYGHSALRKWINDSEESHGKMPGGIGLRFSTKPYRREEGSDEARFKGIIADLYDTPTPTNAQEASLAAAIAYIAKMDAPWLKEFSEGTVERRNSS